MNNRNFDSQCQGAVQQSNGSYINMFNTTKWYNEHGQYHREDGPAVTYNTGKARYWLNDINYSFNEWLKLTPITDEQKLLLRLQYD
jgi:hypothetical protein